MNFDNNKEFDYKAHVYHFFNNEKFVTRIANSSKRLLFSFLIKLYEILKNKQLDF